VNDDDPPDLRRRGEWLSRVFPNLHEPLLTDAAEELESARFSAGEAIVHQGELADALYIIVDGQVRVVREDRPDHEVEVGTLGPGQFFGEMALLTGATRTATVYASTDLRALKLGRITFNRIVRISSGVAVTGANGLTASRSLVAHQDDWVRVIHSACHAIVASHHAVRSVELVGRPAADDDPASLLRLADLARRTASEFGIEVRVRSVGHRPVLHLSAGV